MRSFLPVLLLGISLSASGCLSSTHRIPKSELVRLAQQAPEDRGQRVRVIQTFTSSEQPTQAECASGCGRRSVHIDVTPHGTRIRGRGGRGRPAKVHGSTGHRSSSGGGSLGKIDGDAAAVVAVAVVVAAAAVALVAAGSEGARYDGWANLEPTHPIHLYGPDRSFRAVSLDALTVEDAAWAQHALVRKSEGHWQPAGRAPLDRKGWAYSVFLGAGEIGDAMGSPSLGTTSHIQLGYFPVHEFGLHADLGFGWGAAASSDSSTRFVVSTALEAQLLPFHSHRVHAGGFAQVGQSIRTRSAGGGESVLLSGGAILQLDLTTRLALTARAGITQAHSEKASEMALGISIY